MRTNTIFPHKHETGILVSNTMDNVLVLCCTWLGFILSYTAVNRQVMGPRRMPCGTSFAYGTTNIICYNTGLPIISELLIKRPILAPISLSRRLSFSSPRERTRACDLEESHHQYKHSLHQAVKLHTTSYIKINYPSSADPS